MIQSKKLKLEKEEMKQKQYKIKDMISGEQETVSLAQLIEKLK